jgi:hypothetical protein
MEVNSAIAGLSKPECTNKRSQGVVSNHDISVKDFIIFRSKDNTLWIREVLDSSHPRIFELWWAIYDKGVRGDVWYFTAIPHRNDDKILSNYQLDSIFTPEKDIVIFRVQGSMFRPGGAWEIVGKEFIFRANDKEIILNRVRNAFDFSQ